MEEVHTIINLVRRYYGDERKVCIITPYDGQRAALVAALKAAGLPHGNVYNVDSYQGAQSFSFSSSSSCFLPVLLRESQCWNSTQDTRPRW